MKKSALITGGAKRIGREIVLFLAEKKYDIALTYNKSKKEAKELKTLITEKYGVRCEIFECDISKRENCLKLMKNIFVEFPNLSLLVNNASIFNKSNLTEDENGHEYEQNMAIHVAAPVTLSAEFANNVAKNDVSDANIVNMIDKNVTRDSTYFFHYLLSKKTLANLTKMLASELAPNIRVNAIAPGYILDDDFIEKSRDLSQKIINKIPLKKKGGAQNIVQAIDYLINNDYVTGQTLFVDGGAGLNLSEKT